MRLELNGAVIAKRLKVAMEKEFRMKFSKCYFIVDSEIVRAMIQKESYGFNTFVGVRVGEIQEKTNPTDWYWVEGSKNVADMLTRGNTPLELAEDSEWQLGPRFLKEEERWPLSSSYSGSKLPEKNAAVNLLEVGQQSSISGSIDISRFSNYDKLLRVSACVRSVYTSSPSLRNMATTPTRSDVSVVEKLWIKDAQISLNERLAGKELKRLCALEVDDIIVAGGRLESWMLDTYNNV